MARRVLAGFILLGTILASQKRANATGVPSTFNIQAQIAGEAETLDRMDAREVFSGKAYHVLKKVARAYARPVPHIYILPGDWNMAYIAASNAVDGRGKIVVGKQAMERFNNTALKGFLGHEMAHLVYEGERSENTRRKRH
jgi:Zn-dependent protease with chaperone function